MATLYDIRQRAELLSAKLETGSITPEEVGGLIIDLTDYTQELERDGSTLGIRKVYPSMEAQRADLSPTGSNGKPLRRGNLVAIYDEATASTDTNSGLVSMWTGEGFTPVARIGTALRHENTAIEARLSESERIINDELKEADKAIKTLLEEVSKSVQTLAERLEYTEEERDKLSSIKQDGKEHLYLGADGKYHTLPMRSLSLNGSKRSVDEEGNINLGLGLKASSNKRGYHISLVDDAQSELSSIDIEAQGSSGGGFLNITRLVPLSSGYYTLPTALLALKSQQIAEQERRGLIISIETSQGVWQDYRYIGTSTDDISLGSQNLWEAYAPIQSVEVDGVILPVEGGKVSLRTSSVEVADSVDESDRPVSARAVRAEFDALGRLVFDSDTEQTDDGTRVTLSKDGQQVAEFTVAGGGGSGTTTNTKAVLQASLSKTRIKLGDRPTLSYGWSHYTDSVQDGITAELELTIRRGVQTIETLKLGEALSGTEQSLDLSLYITTAGTYSVLLSASYNEDGTIKVKRNQATLSVVDLSISLQNATTISTYLSKGGYAEGDLAQVHIVVRGGARELRMVIDGDVETAEVRTLSSSSTSSSFIVPINDLSAGLHSLQFVASLDDVKSNSIYLDIVKQGTDDTFVCLLYERRDGAILRKGATPTILAEQYVGTEWQYMLVGGRTAGQHLTLKSPRGEQTFVSSSVWSRQTLRLLERGQVSYRYETENALPRLFEVEVQGSTIEGIGIKEGASVELLATGRSNSEATPEVWRSGATSVRFEGVDFKGSGWTPSRGGQVGHADTVLRLLNGAKAIVDYRPFAEDVKTSGLTIELEVMMSNVRDYQEACISSFDTEGHKTGSFGGLRLSASEISVLTGGTQEFRDEEGQMLSRDLGVRMQIAPDEFYHIALVIHPQDAEPSLRLYVNGVLSKADIYPSLSLLQHKTAQPITLDSSSVDLELRHLRIYETALSDDEVLANYITSRPTLDKMLALRERNNVLDVATGTISYDKLVSLGKGVLHLSMADGGVERLWGLSTDTKTNYKFEELIFRSPLGKAYDLRVTNGIIRRQGTSTSTYPVKNLRIYLNRKGAGTKVYRNVGKGAEDEWELVEGNKYVMREGSKPMDIINLKTDYADSSLTHNTGLAHVYNDICHKVEGMATPPMKSDPSVRSAIDGMPIDVFTSSTPEGEKTYCGQFQFNNDKSKSGYLFGQTKEDGTEIALEGINNMNPLANFHITGSDTRGQLGSSGSDGFDASWEFLYPEKDYLWNGKTAEETAPENIKQATTRLFEFLRQCTPSGDFSKMTEQEAKQAFKSDKFRREVKDYFNVRHLCMWCVFTDYNMSVDQRAKNTFFRTWDGRIWYITYYDGDTAWSIRNDAMSVYRYNINRDTWDAERSKYAFEGHNSVLWNLVIANFPEEIKQCASDMRRLVTNAYLLNIFEGRIASNWSERQYNKSGIYKYIKPATEGFNGDVMNYSFALNGNLYSTHRQILKRRWSLLDAKYQVQGYETDNIPCYVGKGVEAGRTTIKLTAGDEYYFGWKTQNGELRIYQHAPTGSVVELPFEGAISQNDPVRIIGASRIGKIELGSTAPYMQGAMNLGACEMLSVFDGSIKDGKTGQPWFLQLRGISSLVSIDLTGQTALAGTEGATSTLFDVSTHTGLRTLKLSGTAVKAIRIAEGSPLTTLELPRTLTSLRLRALPLLRDSGITGLDYSKITSLELAACPHLDWQTMVARCTSLERLRVEGVDFEDDGTLLRKLSRIKGITPDGRGVDTCSLSGKCQLSVYIDDEELKALRLHYPELSIRQPEYTMIEFDESIADSANISNLDNKTGYKYGTPYQPSGHISRILSERFGCLGKQEVKGQMKVCRLHYENWTKYADHENPDQATTALIDGTDGDVFVYEPRYWYKGVNDILGNKKYACYTTLEPRSMPEGVEVIRIKDLPKRSNTIMRTNALDIASSRVSNSAYITFELEVKPYKRVRVPTVKKTDSQYGILYLNAQNEIVDKVITDEIADGQYLILALPEDIKTIVFSVPSYMLNDERGIVVWSNSDKIEDFEPYWVEHKATLVGSVRASVNARNRLGSCYNPASPSPMTGKSVDEYIPILEKRGLKVFCYDERKDISNLAFAKYGIRNISALVGAPSGATSYSLNDNLLRIGMLDTRGRVYVPLRGIESQVSINGTTARLLGYDNLYGSIGEFAIGLSSENRLKCEVTGAAGEARTSPRGYYSGWAEAKALSFERYMDIVPVTFTQPSGSTRYHTHVNTDFQSFSSRDGFRIISFGGVQGRASLVYMNGTWSNNNGVGYNHAYASGVRIQFVGDIEEIMSVSAYLEIPNNY